MARAGSLTSVREFFGGLSRGELALLVVVAVALIVWAGVGPSGVFQGILPALVAGLVCGIVIGLRRRRSAP